ncbi:MAG: hypothetical protein N4A35_06635 [Flavobacteriales bacterium]|nr:hypothetical protein [Flavobacteriales bacterium]
MISTGTIIIVLPLFGNAAFWLTRKYKRWRINQKHIIEKTQTIDNDRFFNLLNDYKKLKVSVSATIKEEESKRELLESEIFERQERVKVLEDRKTELSKRLNESNEKLKRKEETIGDLKLNVSNLVKKNKELTNINEQKVNTLEYENTQLKEKLKQTEKKLEELIVLRERTKLDNLNIIDNSKFSRAKVLNQITVFEVYFDKVIEANTYFELDKGLKRLNLTYNELLTVIDSIYNDLRTFEKEQITLFKNLYNTFSKKANHFKINKDANEQIKFTEEDKDLIKRLKETANSISLFFI